jgi:hypothetical protein
MPGRAPAFLYGTAHAEASPSHTYSALKNFSASKNIADKAKRLHEQAELLPPGPLREQVLMKARQAETGSHVSEWLRSPELRSPD